MNEQVCESHSVDKTGWPDGPWMTEPDRVQWQHSGYACLLVRRARYGYWCGYVGVDGGHPFYGKDWSDVDAKIERVHRGLSYSARCEDPICHTPEPGMPADVWWFGFDCGSIFDLFPGTFANEQLPFTVTYRAQTYAKHETEKLARQLRAIAESA